MLQKLFKSYNFNFDEKTIKKFEDFLMMFKEKNNQINLSSLRDDESIIEKHFIDSLMLTKFIQLSGNIADIGTGGGFPLIPLAIYDNIQNKDSEINSGGQIAETQFYGIDSVAKKLKSIDEFALQLGLPNVQTIHSRCEDLGQDKEYRETFDFVLSRATAYFPTLLEYAIPLLKVGGIFIAYKMDNENEILEGDVALIKLKSEIVYIKKYELGGQKRSLVFVRKNEKTPKDYPRSSQIIARKSL
ncbi:MAG: 16S rRNA (guanine(527)-N(7))-methyltransferase RsmG [Candidatus Gracilibacteria bacterium]